MPASGMGGAQSAMIFPSLLPLIVPIIVGVVFGVAGVMGLLDRRLEHLGLADELAPNIDVGGVRGHGETGQQAPFEQLGTVMPEETDLEVPQTDPVDATGDDAAFAEPAGEGENASDGNP